jgi:hypothetical protein
MRDPEIIEAELIEISAIADDTIKLPWDREVQNWAPSASFTLCSSAIMTRNWTWLGSGVASTRECAR